MAKITVVGTGYVGLSLAVLLARYHEVTALDIDAERVALINQLGSPIQDPDIVVALQSGELQLVATLARAGLSRLRVRDHRNPD
jgi:UDPglucose 6-dehydrogenase